VIRTSTDLLGPRVLLGDFNDWGSLFVSLLAAHFRGVDMRAHLGSRRTYPGLLPLFNLDHIYYAGRLELTRLRLHRTATALVASDHLRSSLIFASWRTATPHAHDANEFQLHAPVARSPHRSPGRPERGIYKLEWERRALFRQHAVGQRGIKGDRESRCHQVRRRSVRTKIRGLRNGDVRANSGCS
jgi:hypothetical protein